MLVAHLGFSIFSGAFSLYAIFHGNGKTLLAQCILQSNDDASSRGITINATKDCQKALAIFKGVAVGAFVVIWLLEMCTYSLIVPPVLFCCADVAFSDGCLIVHDYSAQLDEEDFIKLPPHRDSETAQINLGRPATEYGP
jgi:hypothetical protein